MKEASAGGPRPSDAAPQGERERQLLVVVLGVHRSGTSLCAHVLNALGVDMADEPVPSPDNLKGHWERWEIAHFHDRILDQFERRYLSPSHDLPLPAGWVDDPRVAAVQHGIIAFLKQRMAAGLPIGFKDPRTARLLPMWRRVFAQLDLDVKFVMCLRHPGGVASSLYQRDGLPADIAEYRWFDYMAAVFGELRDADICTIEYEAWFEAPQVNMAKLVGHLGLGAGILPTDVAAAVSEIVDRDLRHDDPLLREPTQPLLLSLYEAACRLNEDPAARTEIACLIEQFAAFRQLQGWMSLELEALSRLAGTLTPWFGRGADRPLVSWRDPRTAAAWSEMTAAATEMRRIGSEPAAARQRQCAELDALLVEQRDPAILDRLIEMRRGDAELCRSLASALFETGLPDHAQRAALKLPRSFAAGPQALQSATLPRRPVFFRYNAVAEDGEDLILWCRCEAAEERGAANDGALACLRWFDRLGRVLVWESEPLALDLAEPPRWRPLRLAVPPFPGHSSWLRFEVLAGRGDVRVPLCTGFLFDAAGCSGGRATPPAADVLALTAGEAVLDGADCWRDAGSRWSRDQGGPVLVGADVLCDFQQLLFVDWGCFGRPLAAVRLPPPELWRGCRLAVPAGGAGARIRGRARPGTPSN